MYLQCVKNWSGATEYARLSKPQTNGALSIPSWQSKITQLYRNLSLNVKKIQVRLKAANKVHTRSTTEVHNRALFHHQNKLSISASYCNKLKSENTKKKNQTGTPLFTPWFLMYAQSHSPCDWGQMPSKTWGRQLLHGAALTVADNTRPIQSVWEPDRTRLIQCRVPLCALEIEAFDPSQCFYFNDNTDLIWAYLNIKRHWLMLLSAFGN